MNTTKTQAMTAAHPQWAEFIERLEGPEGCNFREVDGEAVWNCNWTRDRPLATAILKKMPDIDVPASLAWFDQNSGLCDCEILFNCAGKGQ